MSQGGSIVVGFVIALLLVPTGMAAAALKYTGIEATNGTTSTLNKTGVTSEGQLLTTTASPMNYEDYQVSINTADGDNGGQECGTVGSAIPAGDAFVVQQVQLDVYEADSPDTYSGGEGDSGGYNSVSGFSLYADPHSDVCDGENLFTTGEAPDGTVGSVSIPLVPGFVVPTGYTIDAYLYGMNADVYVTGYLVPSADATASPQVIMHGKLPIRHLTLAS
jgi:hypothetical protein